MSTPPLRGFSRTQSGVEKFVDVEGVQLCLLADLDEQGAISSLVIVPDIKPDGIESKLDDNYHPFDMHKARRARAVFQRLSEFLQDDLEFTVDPGATPIVFLKNINRSVSNAQMLQGLGDYLSQFEERGMSEAARSLRDFIPKEMPLDDGLQPWITKSNRDSDSRLLSSICAEAEKTVMMQLTNVPEQQRNELVQAIRDALTRVFQEQRGRR